MDQPGGRTLVDLAVGAAAQGRSQLQVVHHAARALPQRLRQAQHMVQLLPRPRGRQLSQLILAVQQQIVMEAPAKIKLSSGLR